MKKLLILTFAMFFIGVGIAAATDFSLTGTYYARGTWVDNWAGDENDTVNGTKNQYGVYDHEMSLDATWQISPVSLVFARLELRDEDWGVASNPTEGGGYRQFNSTTGAITTTANDDNIAVEYLYGQHTLANGKTTFRTGLMKTSAWATSFSDENTDAYRVMLIQNTSFGQLIAFTEKPQNSGASAFGLVSEDNTNDDDIDAYVLALVTKVGGFTIFPLLKYADVEATPAVATDPSFGAPFNNPATFNITMDKYEAFVFDFGAMGNIGNIAINAEFVVADYAYANGTPGVDNDYRTWGGFLEASTQLDAFNLAAFVAHGSYDEDVDKGFEFGDDFTCNGAMILGDEAMMWQNATGFANDIQAATLFGAKASYAASEKMTLSAYAVYVDSNVDNVGNDMDGASAYEVNLQGAYKLTDNVTYSVGGAIAEIELGSSAAAQPDQAIEIFHRLGFTF